MTNIDFSAYLDSRMAIVVIGLIALGGIFKAIKAIKDEWILYILLAVGIAAGCLFIGPNTTGIVQGIIAVAVAVFGNQIFKQAEKASATNTSSAIINNNSTDNTEKVKIEEAAKVPETNAVKNSVASVDPSSGNHEGNSAGQNGTTVQA